MPYIYKGFREKPNLTTVGELNYWITKLCLEYQANRTITDGRMSYQLLNDVIGVLECAKQEFYRRVAVPYENKQCEKNGDVYPNEED